MDMKKNFKFGVVCAAFIGLTMGLTTCGDKEAFTLPEPVVFTPMKGASAERVQFILDQQLDNLFADLEKKSGVQGKISIADVQTKTSNQKLDRVVRFEHPDLCYAGTCPFILLIQATTYTNELDRWTLETMINGSQFAVGPYISDGRHDLFITRNVNLPRYYFDATDSEGPTYLLDTTFVFPPADE